MKHLWGQMIDVSQAAREKVAAEMRDLAQQCRDSQLVEEAAMAEGYVKLILHGSDDELRAVIMTAGVEEN